MVEQNYKATQDKPGAPSCCFYTTQYENQACRVLGWLRDGGVEGAGFQYKDGAYFVGVMGTVTDEIAAATSRHACVIANTDLVPQPLQTFTQLENLL